MCAARRVCLTSRPIERSSCASFRTMSRFRASIRVMVLMCVVILLTACGGSDDPASLDGRWDGGEDWGEVIIDGLEGTYSSTFGAELGTISLTKVSDSEYEGTWNEGETLRFGTLELTLESNSEVTGRWTADPDSDIAGSSGGLLVWER